MAYKFVENKLNFEDTVKKFFHYEQKWIADYESNDDKIMSLASMVVFRLLSWSYFDRYPTKIAMYLVYRILSAKDNEKDLNLISELIADDDKLKKLIGIEESAKETNEDTRSFVFESKNLPNFQKITETMNKPMIDSEEYLFALHSVGEILGFKLLEKKKLESKEPII
jgi:hypothetical protein